MRPRLRPAPLVGAEHQQRRARRGADRGQPSGQPRIGRVVDGEHRLAPPDRGVDQLEAGGQHVLPGRTAHGYAPGRLGPRQRDPGARPGRHSEAAAVPGHDAAGPDRADGRRAPGRHDQAGPGRRQVPLVGVQPAQPAGQGGLGGPGQEGERQLPGQPGPDPGERGGEVQQMVGLVTAGAQVVRYLGGPGGETGRRGPGADRQRSTPARPPPGPPATTGATGSPW